jgi:hypothetical protein
MQLVYGKKIRWRPSNTLTMADTPIEKKNLPNNSPNAMEVGMSQDDGCEGMDVAATLTNVLPDQDLSKGRGEGRGREGKITVV